MGTLNCQNKYYPGELQHVLSISNTFRSSTGEEEENKLRNALFLKNIFMAPAVL